VCCSLLLRWMGCPWLVAGRGGWSGARSGGEAFGALRLRTAQWAWRCSLLSIRPWRAMRLRLLLCGVVDVVVGSCWCECQAIQVTSLVHVDVTSRSWMRALVSTACWARRWSMSSTPAVALTAPQVVRARFTGCLVMVTGDTVSTSLLLYTAVVCVRGCGCFGQACSCCGLQRLFIVLTSAPWGGAAPVETSLVRRRSA
jgi:hypothetical protein